MDIEQHTFSGGEEKGVENIASTKFLIPEAEVKDETVVEYDEIRASELALVDGRVEAFQHIDARVKLRKSTIGVVADFTVNFDVRFNCSRCLQTYDSSNTSQVHLVYLHGQDPYHEKDNVILRPDDIERVYYTGSQLDMAIGIREAIVLAIPIAPVCKEDCQGLCPICGKRKNQHSCDCAGEERGAFTPQFSKKGTPRKRKHRNK